MANNCLQLWMWKGLSEMFGFPQVTCITKQPGYLLTKKAPSYWYKTQIINLWLSSECPRFILGIPIPVRCHFLVNRDLESVLVVEFLFTQASIQTVTTNYQCSYGAATVMFIQAVVWYCEHSSGKYHIVHIPHILHLSQTKCFPFRRSHFQTFLCVCVDFISMQPNEIYCMNIMEHFVLLLCLLLNSGLGVMKFPILTFITWFALHCFSGMHCTKYIV